MTGRYKVIDHGRGKIVQAEGYNSIFDRETGDFARWGNTKEEDPGRAPGPEILDMEIATACDGVGTSGPCRFCYKSNKRAGEQMSYLTFARIFAILPKTVTQIAFGIGNLYGHNDMWKIFKHARDNGVIPNVTINGHALTDEVADKLAAVMGAVAVSRYDRDVCYNAVKKLTDRGMKQVNIHQLVSVETLEDCFQLLHDMETDPRLSKLNAVVFLMLKPKGRGTSLTPLKDSDQYQILVDYALNRKLKIGVDSCSVPSFLYATKNHPDYKRFEMATDRCESGLFSLYVDVDGVAWPCSFGANLEEGIDLLRVTNFTTEVWDSPTLDRWRKKLTDNHRSCPLWDIDITQKR